MRTKLLKFLNFFFHLIDIVLLYYSRASPDSNFKTNGPTGKVNFVV